MKDANAAEYRVLKTGVDEVIPTVIHDRRSFDASFQIERRNKKSVAIQYSDGRTPSTINLNCDMSKTDTTRIGATTLASGLEQGVKALPLFPTSETVGHTYINVLFKEKEEAKRLGAKWDKNRKSWYVPFGTDRAPFQRWMGVPVEPVSEWVSDLAYALRDAGLVLDGVPVMDGTWQRTTVTTSRNHKALKGAYRAAIEDVIENGISVKVVNGFIQNHDTGYARPWSPKDQALTPEQRALFERQAEENRKMRDAELASEREAVAQRSQQKWDHLEAADDSHPYCVRKGVPAIGLRTGGDRLVKPVRDADGNVWRLQYIPADPTKIKMFEKGGQKTGNFNLLGTLDGSDSVLFAEGYATAASLHVATGLPVVEIFDSGNIDAVMRTLKSKLGGRARVMCGDDDVLTDARILSALNNLIASELHSPLALSLIGAEEVKIDGQAVRLVANHDCVMRLEWKSVVAGVPRVVGDITNETSGHRAAILINNVGREKALDASAKHGGAVVFPTFKDVTGILSDFNDLHFEEGKNAVLEQVLPAVDRARAVRTPEECARAALGENFVVVFPKDNRRYVGPIIANTVEHSVQNVGCSTAIAHDLEKLDRVPLVGKSAKIVYQGGRGIVLNNKEKEMSRQS